MGWPEVVRLALLAPAVAVVSMTVTMSKLFSPLRKVAKSGSEWLGELLSCPYCISHWVALAAVLVLVPFTSVAWVVAQVFTLVAFAMPWCWLIYQSTPKGAEE